MATKVETFGMFSLLLAQRVTNRDKLDRMGLLLGMKPYEIDGAMQDARDRTVEAAKQLIQKWRGRQSDPDEIKLLAKLREIFKDEGLGLEVEFKDVENTMKSEYSDRAATSRSSGQVQQVYSQTSASGKAPDPSKSAQADNLIEKVKFIVPEVPTILEKYEIKKYKKLGRVVIINNKDFGRGDIREGTDKDEEKIRDLVSKMGLELSSGDHVDSASQPEMFVLKDQDGGTIRDTLEKVSKLDHSDYACFCCFVLSHGNDRRVKLVDRTSITLDQLTGYFKGDSCRSLIGKPKLFFIQACQGNLKDHGTSPEQADEGGPDSESLPSEADVFIFHATPYGFVSWRHPDVGSRFIQCLCKALEELYGDTEIMEIVAVVNQMLSGIEGENGYKQVSMVTSTLRKKFFFKHQRK